jgi:hypothetical protein
MDAWSVRLAHVLDSLALAIELGLGVPARTVQRTAVISERLARAAGHDDQDVVAAFYIAILCYVGCTTTSHETSQAVDELGLGDLLVITDDEFLPELERMLAATMPPADVGGAARAVAALFARPEMAQHHRNHCEAAELMAKRLELGPAVVGGLSHAYERWDGVSTQQLAAGEGISLPMRSCMWPGRSVRRAPPAARPTSRSVCACGRADRSTPRWRNSSPTTSAISSRTWTRGIPLNSFWTPNLAIPSC